MDLFSQIVMTHFCSYRKSILEQMEIHRSLPNYVDFHFWEPRKSEKGPLK